MPGPNMTLWSFMRAPLAWGVAIVALCAPFAFVEAVEGPGGICWCCWCDIRYVGIAFDPSPDPWALLAIPTAFIAFFAARVAVRGANAYAHWFMAGPVLAILGPSVYFLIQQTNHPFNIFVDVSQSYRPAVLLASQQLAVFYGIIAGFLIALMTLLVALLWRWLRRG